MDDKFFIDYPNFFCQQIYNNKLTKMPATTDQLAQYRGSKTRKTSRKKGVCSHGPRRKGRCPSKKAAASRKRSAAKKIQKAFRRSRK